MFKNMLLGLSLLANLLMVAAMPSQGGEEPSAPADTGVPSSYAACFSQQEEEEKPPCLYAACFQG